jgi:DNA-binding CsgD family transcriptional regulator
MDIKNPLNVDTVNGPKGAAMFLEERWTEIARSLRFSKRELQLTRAIFNEDTDFAIAHTLGLSRHTVHTYCRRLYRKLRVTNRVSLVLRVVQTGQALSLSQGSKVEQPSPGPFPADGRGWQTCPRISSALPPLQGAC